MLRSLPELILLFLIPFAGYSLWLSLQRRYPLALEHWTRAVVSWLGVAGLACAAVGILVLGELRGHERGAYQPAEFRDGQLVPGRFK